MSNLIPSNPETGFLEKSRLRLLAQQRRHGWLTRLRPQVIFDPLLKFFSPVDRRGIIDVDGSKYYIDPFSNLGAEIMATGRYEPDVEDIFKNEIPRGGAVIDVGANEGYFSVAAAKAVGRDGTVVAVEPQSRLHAILNINLALNNYSKSVLYPNAVSLNAGETVKLSLFPSSNTGASSIINQGRLNSAFESVETVTMAGIIDREKLTQVDFIKIDVEGFEYEVIHSMMDKLKAGVVRKILIDYHKPILISRGLRPEDLHQAILDAGFVTIIESDTGYTGYGLYKYQA